MLLEPVHDLLSIRTRKARWTICKLVLSFGSQFFQSLLHLSSQAKERSTIHRCGMTAKVCNSLRLAICTVAQASARLRRRTAYPSSRHRPVRW